MTHTLISPFRASPCYFVVTLSTVTLLIIKSMAVFAKVVATYLECQKKNFILFGISRLCTGRKPTLRAISQSNYFRLFHAKCICICRPCPGTEAERFLGTRLAARRLRFWNFDRFDGLLPANSRKSLVAKYRPTPAMCNLCTVCKVSDVTPIQSRCLNECPLISYSLENCDSCLHARLAIRILYPM